MPLSLMVAVNAPDQKTGLQSHWYRQHRIPYAMDRPEPDETPVSPGSNQVKAQFHLVQRRLTFMINLSQVAFCAVCAERSRRCRRR